MKVPTSQPWGVSPKAWELIKSGVQARKPGDKLRLVNETDWYTPDVRRLVRAALASMGISEARTVRVVHARQTSWSTGHARINSRDMTVRVHSPAIVVDGRHARDPMLPLGRAQVLDLCGCILHEAEHNLGLRHEDMIDGFGGRKHGDRRASFLPWAEDLVVRSKVAVDAARAASRPPPPPPPTLEERAEKRRAAREAKQAKLLAQWERRLRLAQTKVRKYRRSVRAYERAAAMKAKRQGGQPS